MCRSNTIGVIISTNSGKFISIREEPLKKKKGKRKKKANHKASAHETVVISAPFKARTA